MPIQLHSTSGDEGDEARIEIIPLIDIMFFLLASFMMVSLSMTQLNRVPINLPEASTGVADSKAPPFQIAIDPNGVITWDSKIITLSEITTRLREQADPTETRVLISADAESRHRNVLDVLNAVRAAGIEKVSFESKSPPP
ncbi:biopolymer transporter ExbD [bacterium]|nr:biopolymer transporter ExbD [bacterium]